MSSPKKFHDIQPIGGVGANLDRSVVCEKAIADDRKSSVVRMETFIRGVFNCLD